MLNRAFALVAAGVVLAGACSSSKTVVVAPEPRRAPPAQRPVPPPPPAQRQTPGPSTAATLGIPPGHLPDMGECRIWIPGAPPGQQPRPKSRPCAGIAADAPAGSWILYRPAGDVRVVHVRLMDPRRAGSVIRTRIFDIETTLLVREENP